MEQIMQSIEWNDLIVRLVEVILTIVLIPTAKQLYSWLKAKAEGSKYKNLVKYVEMFMESIEAEDLVGEDKKAWVISKVKDLGFKDENLISDIIEAVFRELDKAGLINDTAEVEE